MQKYNLFAILFLVKRSYLSGKFKYTHKTRSLLIIMKWFLRILLLNQEYSSKSWLTAHPFMFKSDVSVQGWPGPRVRPLSSDLPVNFGCRWHLAFLILKEAVCFTGGARVSTDKHSPVGGRTQKHHAAAEVCAGFWKEGSMWKISNLCSPGCCWSWSWLEASLSDWGCHSWLSSCYLSLEEVHTQTKWVYEESSLCPRSNKSNIPAK